MSKITDLINKSGIDDLSEISMLENFFSDSDIIKELEEAEKNRIKRQWCLIFAIPLSIFIVLYMFSLGIIPIEITKDSHQYRPSEMSDGIIWAIFLCLIVFFIIKTYFRSKIEGAIKQKILSKLSKKIYDNLEYDEGKKYAFNNINSLVNQGFLNNYEDIDLVEDSLAFKIQKDGKLAIVQGYELETSKTTRDSKGRRSRTVTNHCYLLKTTIPSARIKIDKNILINTDEADSFGKTLIWAFLGAFIGLFINIFIDSHSMYIVLPILGAFLGYFLRKKYINRDRVKLENTEFEKMFDVHCDDQIGSRMIITPAFMDRLVSFAKKSKYKYEFLFTPDCFYVKWDITSNYLEVNTWKNITTNIGTFVEWYLQMKNIIGLIIDMQILYLSKTESTYLSTEITTEYETFDLEVAGRNSFDTIGFIGKFFKR